MSLQKTILLLITGAALGAAAGVMLAPDSGKRTRRKLRKKAEGLREQFTDLLDQGVSAETEARNAALKASAQASRMVPHTLDGATGSYERSKGSAART